MRVFGVAAMSALLIGMAGWTAPARAQMGGGGDGPHINLLAELTHQVARRDRGG